MALPQFRNAEITDVRIYQVTPTQAPYDCFLPNPRKPGCDVRYSWRVRWLALHWATRCYNVYFRDDSVASIGDRLWIPQLADGTDQVGNCL